MLVGIADWRGDCLPGLYSDEGNWRLRVTVEERQEKAAGTPAVVQGAAERRGNPVRFAIR